jgi:ABC-type ATPase with predicted acetyltransferase domain
MTAVGWWRPLLDLRRRGTAEGHTLLRLAILRNIFPSVHLILSFGVIFDTASGKPIVDIPLANETHHFTSQLADTHSTASAIF